VSPIGGEGLSALGYRVFDWSRVKGCSFLIGRQTIIVWGQVFDKLVPHTTAAKDVGSGHLHLPVEQKRREKRTAPSKIYKKPDVVFEWLSDSYVHANLRWWSGSLRRRVFFFFLKILEFVVRFTL
jgi:hypothetical protein